MPGAPLAHCDTTPAHFLKSPRQAVSAYCRLLSVETQTRGKVTTYPAPSVLGNSQVGKLTPYHLQGHLLELTQRRGRSTSECGSGEAQTMGRAGRETQEADY